MELYCVGVNGADTHIAERGGNGQKIKQERPGEGLRKQSRAGFYSGGFALSSLGKKNSQMMS